MILVLRTTFFIVILVATAVVLIREQLIAYLKEKHPESLPRSRVELSSTGDAEKKAKGSGL